MLIKLRKLAKYGNPKRWREICNLGMNVFVICVLAVTPSISFAETLDVNYMEFNPDVVLSQDNGGSFEVGTLFSGNETWIVTTPGDLLVLLKSSTYGQYSTLAVNDSTSKRYGQIMVRLAKILLFGCALHFLILRILNLLLFREAPVPRRTLSGLHIPTTSDTSPAAAMLTQVIITAPRNIMT